MSSFTEEKRKKKLQIKKLLAFVANVFIFRVIPIINSSSKTRRNVFPLLFFSLEEGEKFKINDSSSSFRTFPFTYARTYTHKLLPLNQTPQCFSLAPNPLFFLNVVHPLPQQKFFHLIKIRTAKTLCKNQY